MTQTVEHDNGHSHSGGGSGESSGGGSGGRSGDTATKSFARRQDYDPEDQVQVRITAASRDRFDAWYAGQFPGVVQLPSRDPWIDEVFRLGLDEIERLMPPVLSPRERLAAARKGGQS